MKKIFSSAVLCIVVGVIVYGSGSVGAVQFDEDHYVKGMGVSFVNNNTSFLAPMIVNYVASPLFVNAQFSLSHMKQHDVFSHHMTTEYKT